MGQHIQPHQIDGLEHSGFGPTHGRTEEGVHLGDGQPLFQHQLHGAHDAVHPDAVADEIGRVFSPHDSFAQPALPEIGHELEHLGRCLFAGNQFQQFHVAHRVEKVRSQKMVFEIVAQPFAQLLERQSRSVGRNDGPGLAHALDPFEQRLFDRHIFHDHLDNPVAAPQQVEVVFQIADADAVYIFRVHQKGRVGLAHGVEARADNPVACFAILALFGRQIRGNNVQQQSWNAGAGQQGRDAAAHDAGTNNGRLVYSSNHRPSSCFGCKDVFQI